MILLNGCSFMDNWYYADYLKPAVNLAKPGSCNRRIIRTTVDYIEQNPVDTVILGLTFYNRQESPFKEAKSDPWVSYNSQGIQAVFSDPADFNSLTEYKLIDDYVLSRYRYDINQHYLDSLYLDLKMFSSYLRERSIKYCIFNMCETHHKNVKLGPGFVPFDFIGNNYLENNKVSYMDQDELLPTNARHHYGKDAIILIDYLIKFINDNKV
jgi:hypothetical protein